MDLDSANMYADGIKRDINNYFKNKNSGSLKWLQTNVEYLLEWIYEEQSQLSEVKATGDSP